MAIGKVPGSSGGLGAGGLSPRPANLPRGDAERAAVVRAPASTSPQAAIAEVDAGVPMVAPPGVDPALWSVLTAEERQFFGKLSGMGPLTYGPRSANVPPALVRGGRIDRTV